MEVELAFVIVLAEGKMNIENYVNHEISKQLSNLSSIPNEPNVIVSLR